MATEHQFCTFRIDGLHFGVPVLAVQEVIRYLPMTPVPLAPPVIRGLINLRGQIITAVDLRRRLELPGLPDDRPPMNVIVRTGEGVVSLLVDEIGEVIEADPDAHERPPETLTGVARELITGVYKLKDELLLVMDPDRATSPGGVAA